MYEAAAPANGRRELGSRTRKLAVGGVGYRWKVSGRSPRTWKVTVLGALTVTESPNVVMFLVTILFCCSFTQGSTRFHPKS
jgi:hypothetical protein